MYTVLVLALMALLIILTPGAAHAKSQKLVSKRFPAECEEHIRTFMSWPSSAKMWSGGRLAGVRLEIVAIAQAISRFEPVVVFARPQQVARAEKMLGPEIKVEPIPVNDVWARDTFPAFIKDSTNNTIAIDFNYNGYGKRQAYEKDKLVASRMAKLYEIPLRKSSLVTEGGAIETDGSGTLLTTESALVNNNRNPGKSRDEIETELKNCLGVTKVIWFKGVQREITDSHVDCIARFIRPGVVLISRPASNTAPNPWSNATDNAYKILKKSTDARGNQFEIIELPEPDLTKITGSGKDFLATYINFYIANGAVILARFNDVQADEKAKEILQSAFPTRKIVQVQIDILSTWDGGIHCATHQQPKP